MNILMTIKDFFCSKTGVLSVLAAAGSAIAHYLGGWDGFLKVLLAMMICDYVTGILVAAVWKNSGKSETGALDSRAGFKGICKKCIILMLVWLGAMLDQGLNMGYVRTAVCIFFIGNEGLSLLENVGLMGVPYPTFLKNALEALRKQGDAGKQSEGETK